MSRLRAESLGKRYRSRQVVADLSLEVASGEVVGLLAGLAGLAGLVRLAARRFLRVDRDAHAARLGGAGIRRNALPRDVVYERRAADLVLAVAQPRVAGELHCAVAHVVLDDVGASPRELVVFLEALLERGGLAAHRGARDLVVAEAHHGVARSQLAVRYRDAHVALEDPLRVGELETGGARLGRFDRELALGDPDLPEHQRVVAVVEIRRRRLEVDRRLLVVRGRARAAGEQHAEQRR